jgi:Cu-Zn family superoxide dismutase
MNLSKILIILSGVLIASCNNETNTKATEADSVTTTTTETPTASTTAEAVLSGTNADTTLSGTVRFAENNGQVKMTLDVQIPKMANKTVAVHIHEHGSCGDMGKEAHGHWNPTKANHGKWGSDNFHRGDIGNVDLNGEGKGTLELDTDLWSISGSDSTKNILNKAIIVHGGKDDFTTQPTGNAGSRIGCGVIQTAR